ncbi:hypothetical protein MSG28_004892 [Choristoneura fumiferana]|uniref:Uncharacterized protein n=1 Tax=Choristoneura fumiferana TaxID=7141 RepID=A0ACC0JP32_CHOFU|nr:hypothetical protein MSG28_004892 [Choristoneura fumiferana]
MTLLNQRGDTICPTGLFRCPEGTCIEYSRVCNYQRDCEKGEDEFQNCPYGNVFSDKIFCTND